MNDIDVSKCEYYNDYYKTCSNFSRCGDDEPYCDPKNFECSYYINNIEKQLQQLKAENEELKRQHQADKGLITMAGKQNYQLIQEYDKLKNCLTEIKEIAERNHKTKEELFKIRHSRLTKFSIGALNGRHNLASEILQKISECEVEDEN